MFSNSVSQSSESEESEVRSVPNFEVISFGPAFSKGKRKKCKFIFESLYKFGLSNLKRFRPMKTISAKFHQLLTSFDNLIPIWTSLEKFEQSNLPFRVVEKAHNLW